MTYLKERMLPPSGRRARAQVLACGVASALVASTLVLGATSAVADPIVTDNGWSYTKDSFATDVQSGYQLALDPENRKVYLSDAAWRQENRAEDGTITLTREPTGKLVEFDTAARSFVKNHDFTGLTRVDGSGRDSDPFNWTGVTANSQTSMRTTFSPYGVAVDGTTPGGATIVTTTARQQDSDAGYGGGVVIYNASQGAPSDADRVFEFDDGSPVLQGPRRIAVNTQTHKAYVTSLGTQRSNGPDAGYITQIDLLTKQVEARITVPGGVGAVGVAVDEEHNRIYAGSMAESPLYVIDGNAVDTSDAKSLTLNDGSITALATQLPENQRPTYSPELKRLYVATYAAPAGTITVVDADPASASYGQTIDTIVTGPSNAVEIDGERGLLYSANLGDQSVAVFDTETHEQVLTLPTSGNALNIGIDPVTRDVWVSNFSNAAVLDVFSVTAPDAEEPGAPEEIEYTTPDGAKYWVPAMWTEGEALTIRGEGWTWQTGSTGSTIGIKLNAGTIKLTDDPYGDIADSLWGYVVADADGTWTTTLPYPSAEVTGQPATIGQVLTINFLTGGLAPGDRIRSVVANVTVAAVGSEEPEEPGEPEEPVITGAVTVTFGVDAAEGGLSLHVASDTVDLGSATLNAGIDQLVAEGALPSVRVADTRASQLGWTVSGASSSFSGTDGTELAGASLGWRPRVVSTSQGQSVTAGPVIAPVDGFTSGSTLIQAPAGQSRGTAEATAGLRLEAPTTTPVGSYSGTLTLTLT